MNKRILVKLCVAAVVAGVTTSASANGLLGKHYLGAAVNSVNWGDSTADSLFGRSNGGTVIGNYNLAENWDLNASYSGLWDSYTAATTNDVDIDFEAHAVMAGLNYLFPNKTTITPYIGGSVGAVITKVNSDSESDTAYAAELGAEWNMCEEAFLTLAAIYDYVDDNSAGNNGNYGISALAGIKVIEHLTLVGGASYIIEEEDATVTVGLVIVQ